MSQKNESVSCIRCRHYHVTWDPQFPYGCRALGFKAHKSPSLVVYESSGMECQLYEPKTTKR